MLIKTRRGLLAFFLLIIGSIYLVSKYLFPAGNDVAVADENVYIFEGVSGPSTPSVIPPRQITSWKKYHTDNPSALAILLTDTASNWLGLAHGLAGIGIPFIITNNTAEAISHKVVMVYPLISGKVLAKEDLQAIAAVPRNGGTLIATNVYGGGLNEVFAYDDIKPLSPLQNKLKLNMGTGILQLDSVFKDAINGEIVLAGEKTTTQGVCYTGAKTPLISYGDGTGCLLYKDYGVGKAFALGLDLGGYFLRNMNGRAFDPNRAYVNRYEAGIDIFLRALKQIYEAGNPDAVTIHPQPYNKPFAMIISHDVDFTKSIVNAAQYAEMEQKNGVKATYFIQTKYIRDWNDDIFFNDANIQFLKQVQQMGMEIGSHSVSHSRVFSGFPEGTGNEAYPAYRPFVKEKKITYNGTVLGELRVSKFLLGNYTDGKPIRSFRPGHLQYPFSLPQSLVATGFENSSSVTGGSVQTNLPYMMMYNREYDAELNIVEVPIAVEDELGLPMLQRFDSTVMLANTLSKYGGVLTILIHTDILGQKFAYEEKAIAQFKDVAWVSTIGDMCDWWRLRNDVTVTVVTDKSHHTVTLHNSGANVNGLTLQVPRKWTLSPTTTSAHQLGGAVVIDEWSSALVLSFVDAK